MVYHSPFLRLIYLFRRNSTKGCRNILKSSYFRQISAVVSSLCTRLCIPYPVILEQHFILKKKVCSWFCHGSLSKERDVANPGSCHVRQNVKGSFESYYSALTLSHEQ